MREFDRDLGGEEHSAPSFTLRVEYLSVLADWLPPISRGDGGGKMTGVFLSHRTLADDDAC